MLDRSAVMPLLLEACPSFVAPWNSYVASERVDEDLLYIDLAVFARHVVALAAGADATAELAAIFATVERLQLEGDDDVQEATVIGLLEGVLFAAEHAGMAEARFTRFFGPESARAWRDLEAFWSRLADGAQRVA